MSIAMRDIRLWLLVRILFLTVSCLTISWCYHGGTTVYVEPTDNSAQCPQDGRPCHTLGYYTQNDSTIGKFFASNVEMIFLSGQHNLSTSVQVCSSTNFIMRGTRSNSDDKSQPGSRIYCKSTVVELSKKKGAGFHFLNSTEMHIQDLEFDGCGTKRSLNKNSIIQSALIFERICNVEITKTVITNSKSIGIYAHNSVGKLTVKDSTFSRSLQDNSNYINAKFNFSSCEHDHNAIKLTIETSQFLNGYNTVLGSGHLHSATGLTIILNCPSIQVEINNTVASNNTGGNLAITLINFPENPSNITIVNSHMNKGRGSYGVGLDYWSKTAITNGQQHSICYSEHTALRIINTTFTGNHAKYAAGAVFITHSEQDSQNYCGSRKINFINCTFTKNSVTKQENGAAVVITKLKPPNYMQQMYRQEFEASFNGCRFKENGYDVQNHTQSIVEAISFDRLIVSESSFTRNTGTPISLTSTSLIVEGHVLFEENNSNYGGALRFCERSQMYIQNSTNVQFIGNKAKSGGAIYVQNSCLETAPVCFFQPIIKTHISIKELSSSMQLQFINNSAEHAGDAVYGGSVNACYTQQIEYIISNYSGPNKQWYISRQIFLNIFDFSMQQGRSNISSDPYMISFCKNNELDLEKKNESLKVYPGETFSLSVSAVGQFSGTTESSMSISKQEQTRTFINFTEKTSVRLTAQKCMRAYYTLSTTLTNKTAVVNLVVKTSSLSNSLPDYLGITNPELTLDIQPCPWGFELNTAKGKCVCEKPLHTKFSVVCDIDSKTIRWSSQSVWIGKNTENDSELIYSRSCYPIFCKEDQKSILTLDSRDDQCVQNRTGIICTKCEDGLSLTLGIFNKCKKCSNDNCLPLLLLFLVEGLLLIVILTALNLTVTEGTINGLLFYANILHVNHEGYFPSDSPAPYIIQTFVAILSLDSGLNMCFYKGMNYYQKIWLEILFLFYICFLLFVIVCLSRRYIFFTRLVGKNVVKVIATVLLMCQPKVVYIAIQASMFTNIHLKSSVLKSVWIFDSDLDFGQGKHLILLIVTVVLFWLAFLLTLALFFIQCLQRGTDIQGIRWIGRLRPLFEAYTGPYHTHYRFWPGFLLLLRIFMFIGYSLLTEHKHIKHGGTAVICILVLSFACVSPRGVYKKWPLNILEFSYIFNLALTSGLMSYNVVKVTKYDRIMYPSVSVAMFTFGITILYHAHVRIKNSRICIQFSRKIRARFGDRVNTFVRCERQAVSPSQACTQDDLHSTTTRPSGDIGEEAAGENTPLLRQMPGTVNFDQYREPLLSSS